MEEEKLYYCSDCVMVHRLPLRGPSSGEDLVAGYCRFCGVASPLIGHVTRSEAESRGIVVPALEELATESLNVAQKEESAQHSLQQLRAKIAVLADECEDIYDNYRAPGLFDIAEKLRHWGRFLWKER